MASSAPFGTDLQPDFDVKVIAGKLVEINKVYKKVPKEESIKDEQAANALMLQIFGSAINRQFVEEILLSCFRWDTLGRGLLSRNHFQKILHEHQLTVTDKQLLDLIRTTNATSTGIATDEIHYQKLCSTVMRILNRNKSVVFDERNKKPCADMISRAPLDVTSHALSSSGARGKISDVASRVQLLCPFAQHATTSPCNNVACFQEVGDKFPYPTSKKRLLPVLSQSCPAEYFSFAQPSNGVDPFANDDHCTVRWKSVVVPQLSGSSNNLMTQEGLFCLKRALNKCSSLSGINHKSTVCCLKVQIFKVWPK